MTTNAAGAAGRARAGRPRPILERRALLSLPPRSRTTARSPTISSCWGRWLRGPTPPLPNSHGVGSALPTSFPGRPADLPRIVAEKALRRSCPQGGRAPRVVAPRAIGYASEAHGFRVAGNEGPAWSRISAAFPPSRGAEAMSQRTLRRALEGKRRGKAWVSAQITRGKGVGIKVAPGYGSAIL